MPPTLPRSRATGGLVLILSVALLAGCGSTPTTELSNAISGAVAGITPAPVSERHLGFDTYSYPGDAAMTAWRDESVPYEWVGYYLEAPCHKDNSWSGNRQKLTQMGWGLAVIYVGQQTWGGTPGKPQVRTKYVTKYATANGARERPAGDAQGGEGKFPFASSSSRERAAARPATRSW
jgi:hypothetical protein